MQKINSFWGLFCCIGALMLASGCIEISEEVTVNENGSGNIRLSVDMGALAASLNTGNTTMNVSILEEIKKIVAEAPTRLEKCKGIHTIKAGSNEKKGTYAVSFDFDNSKALNEALLLLAGAKKGTPAPKFYKITAHKFIRKDLSPYVQRLMKKQNQGSANEMFYSYITLKSTFAFPKAVKKSSNIRSEINNSNTVISKFTLDEMIKGIYNTGHKITY